jgi:hypothetical protein
VHTLIAAAVLTTSADAAAGFPNYCITGADPTTGHYYAVLESNGPVNADRAVALNINTSQLDDVNCDFSNGFVTHELWYKMDTRSGNYWIEAGFISGDAGGGCQPDADFWADNRPNGGGFNIHYPGNGWSLNTWYTDQIQWAGQACTWNIFLGGLNIGTSTSFCAPPGSGRILIAGLEATSLPSGGIYGGGFSSSWGEQDDNNTWRTWENPFMYCNETAEIIFTNNKTQTSEALNGPF